MKKHTPINTARFALWPAAGGGFVFVYHNWQYLLKLAMPAILAEFVTGCYLRLFREGQASVFEAFLVSLPSIILSAWVVFALTRFMVFGERLDQPDRRPKDIGHWRWCFKLSVLLALVFKVFITLASALVEWVDFDPSPESADWGSAFLLVTGTMILFWGLRFTIFPVVAAVGYPIRVFLRKISGFDFSFRILIVGLYCMVPIVFVLQLLIYGVVGSIDLGEMAQTLVFLSAGSVMSLTLILVFHAACVLALKEILGDKNT